MTTDIDRVVAAAALGDARDGSSLQRAGLDSLAVLRLAAQVVGGEGEIDPAELATVRTVGDLKRWLRRIAPAAPSEGRRS